MIITENRSFFFKYRKDWLPIEFQVEIFSKIFLFLVFSGFHLGLYAIQEEKNDLKWNKKTSVLKNTEVL